MKLAAALFTAAALTVTGAAAGTTATLNSIASDVAGRPVAIHRVKSFTDPSQAGEASYNADRTGPGDSATIVSSLCTRIRLLIRNGHFAPSSGYWQTAALGILVHEATHLAGGPLWQDETDVQCRALRTLPTVIASLGLTGFHKAWLTRWQRSFPPEYTLHPC